MELFLTRMRQLRKNKNLGQQELANLLEISYSTYKRYESGEREPGVWLAARMADFFGVSIDYLLGRTDQW